MNEYNKLKKDISSFKKKIAEDISARKTELALQEIKACAAAEYYFNQTAYDSFLESCLLTFSDSLEPIKDYSPEKNTVVFYDGFNKYGDLVAIYLSAFVVCGYHVIYLTYRKKEDKRMTALLNSVSGERFDLHFLRDDEILSQASEILGWIKKYRPKAAFFYTTPYDVSGYLAFAKMPASICRYLIDLTDHAFWLGRNVCDYFIEFRAFGEWMARRYRKISGEKIIRLPYYPEINYDIRFEGFPFEVGNRKVIFSGGSIYKTEGESGKYFELISEILDGYSNSVFWYAGNGDFSPFRRLAEKYPGRVFYTKRREDLFQVFQHVDLYINTYPIGGGLMLQYAALAGVQPLSLTYCDEEKGILINEDALGVYFPDEKTFIDEAVRILKYGISSEKKEKLKAAVISIEKFQSNIKSLIEERKTEYCSEFVPQNVTAFRQLYVEKIDSFHIPQQIRLFYDYPPIFNDLLKSKGPRQLVIWGCGVGSEKIISILQTMNINVDGYVDSDSKSIGRFRNKKVLSPKEIDRKKHYIIVSLLSNVRTITEILALKGFVHKVDYIYPWLMLK